MSGISNDLLDHGFVQNPSPLYSELRENHPCYWNDRWRGWVLSRYEDVYGAMHNPKILADRITPYFKEHLAPAERENFAPIYDVLHSFVVFRDPPDHTHLRRIFSRAFTPKAVATMRTVVEAYVREFFDAWEGRDLIDINADFAYPFPANVIATILGAPREDVHNFHGWSEGMTMVMLAENGAENRMDTVKRSLSDLKNYLQGIYEERRRQPRDDMMSWLLEVQRDDPTLTPDDVVHSCILLLVAGHETTQSLIVNTLTTLLQLPDQLQLLRDNPQYIKTAIEEGLRYNGPVKGTIRIAGEDMEIAGSQVRRGDRLLLLIGAANRDPAKFVDPERFDITRNPNPHLSFSHGLHFCLGAPLARLEMEIAFAEMLRRFPKMELVSEIKWVPRILGRSIQAPVHVALG